MKNYYHFDGIKCLVGFTLVGILTCRFEELVSLWWESFSSFVENFGVAFALPPNIGKTYNVI